MRHIETIKGIESKPSFLNQTRHFCTRCENDDPTRFTTFNCAKCEGPCTYCRHCLKMGRVSSCTELIVWRGEQPEYPTTHTLAWQGTLTPLQQKASDELIESQNKQVSHLIYAVCGSGKTEIMFQPIINCSRKENVSASQHLESTSFSNSNRDCAQHSRKQKSKLYTAAPSQRWQNPSSSSRQPISCTDSVTHLTLFLSTKRTHSHTGGCNIAKSC